MFMCLYGWMDCWLADWLVMRLGGNLLKLLYFSTLHFSGNRLLTCYLIYPVTVTTTTTIAATAAVVELLQLLPELFILIILKFVVYIMPVDTNLIVLLLLWCAKSFQLIYKHK